MADFAPNYTARYRVRYTVLGKNHKMQFRLARGTSDVGNIALKVAAYLSALSPTLFTNFTVLGAEFAPEDSDIFLPVAPPVGFSPPALAIPGAPISEQSLAWSFVGRSIGGLQCRLFLYGAGSGPENVGAPAVTFDDWRLTSVQSGIVNNAVIVLNNSSPSLVGNDNQTAVWYPYANFKYNNYWVRRTRA